MKKNLLLYGSIGLLGICLSSIAFANSSLYSLKAANPANNNQLSAQNWDRLVSEVEKIQTSPASNKTQRDALLNEVQQLKLQVSNASSGSGIPAGAIMAFDLSTCPAWWTRYAAADNRFIMGAQSGLKSVGGNSQIMMQANQLAPHSHWFVDSYFADGHEESYANHWQRNPALRHTIDRISWQGWNGLNAWNDFDNYLYTVYRKTGSKPVSGGSNVKNWTTIHNDSRGYGRESREPDSNWFWNQQPLNILNPYIKLLYCKKN